MPLKLVLLRDLYTYTILCYKYTILYWTILLYYTIVYCYIMLYYTQTWGLQDFRCLGQFGSRNKRHELVLGAGNSGK